MDIVVFALLGLSAAVAWLVLAGVLALLAGRVIRERDAHDRPAALGARRPAVRY